MFAQIAVNFPNAEKMLLAAGPPAVIAVILLAVQIKVISKIENRQRRTALIILTTGIQATVLTLWALAWAMGTF